MSPIVSASDLIVTPVSPRDVTPVSPHASDFRAITDNSLNTVRDASSPGRPAEDQYELTVPVLSNGKATVTKEGDDVTPVSPHAARIAQAGPLKGLSAATIRRKLLAPNGKPCEPTVEIDAWDAANSVVRRAGGEDFNPGEINKLIEEYGPEQVWFQAQWFLRRLASLPNPPDKPTAYFVNCVREDHAVNATWPEYQRWTHGRISDAERDDLPSIDSPLVEWYLWMNRHGWLVTDLPVQIEARLYEALTDRDPDILKAVVDSVTPADIIGDHEPKGDLEESIPF